MNKKLAKEQKLRQFKMAADVILNQNAKDAFELVKSLPAGNGVEKGIAFMTCKNFFKNGDLDKALEIALAAHRSFPSFKNLDPDAVNANVEALLNQIEALAKATTVVMERLA